VGCLVGLLPPLQCDSRPGPARTRRALLCADSARSKTKSLFSDSARKKIVWRVRMRAHAVQAKPVGISTRRA
jgi:hypothetical protein